MNNTNTTNQNPLMMGTVDLNTGKTTPGTQTTQPLGNVVKEFNQSMVKPVSPVVPTTIPQTQAIGTLGTQPVNLPSANLPQATPQINQAEQVLKQTAVADTEAQKSAQNISRAMLDLIPQLQGQGQELANQQKAFGVQDLKQNVLNLNNQIIQKQAEIQKDDITLANTLSGLEGGGILGSIVARQQLDTQKKAQLVRSLKMADIGILNAQVLAAQGNLALAQDSAKQAVETKYAPYKELLDTYKMQLEAIQPILTSDEKKQAREQNIKTELALNDLKLQKENEQKANDMVINAMAFAPQNVTANAMQIAKNGGSLVQVAQALGKYAGDFIGNQIKLTNLQENQLKIKKLSEEIKNSGATIPNNSPVGSTNYSLTSWVNSAENKNSLAAEERASIGKAFSLVNQLGALQTNLKKDQTSFFGGKVKEIMASFGQDADAGVINSQITALVPQVAKGIYGEVGVLTDQDTARYKSTLPNLTSPQKQNDAVTALTLTALRNGVKAKLDVAAASKLDVSGFVPLYQDLTERINELNDNTGVNDVRVTEIVQANPQTKQLVADLIKQGRKGSEILKVLGVE